MRVEVGGGGGRPRDWSALGRGEDPVPGDPDVVRRASRHYDQVADEIESQVRRLRAIGSSDLLEGEYKETLVEASTKAAGQLEKVSGRYRTTAAALRPWPAQLEGYQRRSASLLTQAQAALGSMDRAGDDVGPWAQPPAAGTQEDVDDWTRRQKAWSNASQELEDLRRDLHRLELDLDEDGRDVARRIREGADDDVKDGWWDNFLDFMDRWHDVIDVVAKVLGAIGMVLLVVSLFVPGLNLLVAGVLVGVAALLAHTALAASGHGSWADVALDAFSLATLGTGRLAVGALKGGQAAVRALGAVRAGREAERTVRAVTSAQRALLGTRMARGGRAGSIARAEHHRITQAMNRQAQVARAHMAQIYREADLAVAPLRSRVARGLDPEVAALSDDIARVVRDFPTSAPIRGAAAATRTATAVATGAGFVGAGASAFGVYADWNPVPGWDDLKKAWTTTPGSSW
ncbi:hypothetical protein [Thalassiella azotivora]